MVTQRRWSIGDHRRCWLIAGLVVGLLLLGATAVLAAKSKGLKVSGREVRFGTSCIIDGEAGKCGIAFWGWTGGKGPVPNGWVSYPGDGQGIVHFEGIDYVGAPDFDTTVQVKAGAWRIEFRDNTSFSGSVTEGTVTWPKRGKNLGCGKDVAKIDAILSIDGGGAGSLDGCLDDVHPLIPKVWGVMERG